MNINIWYSGFVVVGGVLIHESLYVIFYKKTEVSYNYHDMKLKKRISYIRSFQVILQ